MFDGTGRETRKMFIEPLFDNTRNVLLAAVKKRIHLGATIVSNHWQTCERLKGQGYVHLTVNHSCNFLDPATGAYIQHVERTGVTSRRKFRVLAQVTVLCIF